MIEIIHSKDEVVTSKGPDSSKIVKLTSEVGEVQGNKGVDFGAAAPHFDVCWRSI